MIFFICSDINAPIDYKITILSWYFCSIKWISFQRLTQFFDLFFLGVNSRRAQSQSHNKIHQNKKLFCEKNGVNPHFKKYRHYQRLHSRYDYCRHTWTDSPNQSNRQNRSRLCKFFMNQKMSFFRSQNCQNLDFLQFRSSKIDIFHYFPRLF